jgi:hypothetical protein
MTAEATETAPAPKRRTAVGRCRACGDRIYSEDDLMRVTRGQLHESGELEDFDEESGVWGYMHRRCFLLAIRDPEAISLLG